MKKQILILIIWMLLLGIRAFSDNPCWGDDWGDWEDLDWPDMPCSSAPDVGSLSPDDVSVGGWVSASASGGTDKIHFAASYRYNNGYWSSENPCDAEDEYWYTDTAPRIFWTAYDGGGAAIDGGDGGNASFQVWSGSVYVTFTVHDDAGYAPDYNESTNSIDCVRVQEVTVSTNDIYKWNPDETATITAIPDPSSGALLEIKWTAYLDGNEVSPCPGSMNSDKTSITLSPTITPGVYCFAACNGEQDPVYSENVEVIAPVEQVTSDSSDGELYCGSGTVTFTAGGESSDTPLNELHWMVYRDGDDVTGESGINASDGSKTATLEATAKPGVYTFAAWNSDFQQDNPIYSANIEILPYVDLVWPDMSYIYGDGGVITVYAYPYPDGAKMEDLHWKGYRGSSEIDLWSTTGISVGYDADSNPTCIYIDSSVTPDTYSFQAWNGNGQESWPTSSDTLKLASVRGVYFDNKYLLNDDMTIGIVAKPNPDDATLGALHWKAYRNGSEISLPSVGQTQGGITVSYASEDGVSTWIKIDSDALPGTYCFESWNTKGQESWPVYSENMYVLPVKMKDISFSGPGYMEVRHDNGITIYSAPQWKIDSSNQRTDNPIAYQSDTYPSIGATFKVDGLNYNGIPIILMVRASGDDNITITDSYIGNSGDDLYLAETCSSEAFDSKVRFYDTKNQYGFHLNWEVSGDGSTWYKIDDTYHTLYVTLNYSQSSFRQETFFLIGCKAADGESNYNLVISDIVGAFAGRYLCRASDRDNPLTYYGDKAFPYNSTFYIDEVLASGAYARCGAFQSLMVGVLNTQGIMAYPIGVQLPAYFSDPPSYVMAPRAVADYKNVYNTDLSAKYGSGRDVFFVKDWSLLNRPKWAPLDMQGKPAQNNSDPLSLFGDHALVRVDNDIYDPSYGTGPFTWIGDWENQSIDGYGAQFFGSPVLQSGDWLKWVDHTHINNQQEVYEQ